MYGLGNFYSNQGEGQGGFIILLVEINILTPFSYNFYFTLILKDFHLFLLIFFLNRILGPIFILVFKYRYLNLHENITLTRTY